MARILAIEFPVADEGDVTSATLAVQRLLDGLAPTTVMVAAVSDLKGLETQLLADGGAKARASLGSAEAQQIFDAILRESVATIAVMAPGDSRFIAAALPNVLQRQKQVDTRIHAHDREIDELRAIVLSVGSPSEEPTEPLVRGYRNEIQALAPDALDGRGAEIAEIARFSRMGGQYWWWRAEPWTGKTALMATLALTALPGIETVSFFILGREDAANTRARFYAHVMPQLALMAGRRTLRISSDAAQARDQFNDLLCRAAEACSREGNRLLLLVDGLDEDAFLLGSDSHQGSIAAAIPSHLPSGATVLVASRTNPQLPDDVPTQHPLRDQECWHDLAASPAAHAARQAAEADLRDLVKIPLGMEIASTIAAARAPLTSVDLSEIIGASYMAVLGLMDSRPARALVPVQSAMGVGYPPAYRLGHAKLDESLVAVLDPRAPARADADADPLRWEVARAGALATWRDRIYVWGQGWAARGWPVETPGYLLGDAYLALLDQDRRTDELIEVLTDIHRANLLYQYHQADYAALRQIRTAATQITDQLDPDLGQLGRLMVTHERLAARNDSTPLSLLELLVFTDRAARAAGIARGISDPEPRVRALLAVANSCLTAGYRDGAMAVIQLADESLGEIQEPQASILAKDVARWRAAADRDMTRNTADRYVEPFSLPVSSGMIAAPDEAAVDSAARAANLLSRGDAAGARRILLRAWARLHTYSSRAASLHALVQVSGEAGLHADPVTAWQDLTRIFGAERAWPLGVELVRGLAKGGHQAAAEGLARHLMQAAEHVDNEARRVGCLAAAANAMLVVGDYFSAASVVDAALALVTAGPTIGARLRDDLTRVEIWKEVLCALALSGDSGASDLAADLLVGPEIPRGLVSVIRGSSGVTGSEAAALLERVVAPHERAAGLQVLAERADPDLPRLHGMVGSITDAEGRARALAALALAAERLHPTAGLALGLAAEAATEASNCTSPSSRQRALVVAGSALAAVGDDGGARLVIDRLVSRVDKARSLATAGIWLGRLGETDRALAYAEAAASSLNSLDRPGDREAAQADLAAALAAAGRLDQALDVAEAIGSAIHELRAIERVATEMGAGHFHAASRLASHALKVPNSPASMTSRPLALIAIAAQLAKLHYIVDSQRLIDDAVASGEGLPGTLDRAVTLASASAVISDFSPRLGTQTLAIAWVTAGCPWLGWTALAKLRPDTVLALGRHVREEAATGEPGSSQHP